MDLFNPFAFWLALTIPPIILFYFLRLRRRDRPVPSLLLWEQVLQDVRANAPWQRLRASLLLFLQVLAAACLTLAVARPFVPLAGGSGELLVVLLDASASMQAADERPDRFTAAKEKVAALIDGMGPRDRMALVAFAARPEVLSVPTPDRTALRRVLSRAGVTGGRGRLDEALSLALSLVQRSPRASLVIVSDGGVEEPAVAVPGDVRVRFLPVGLSAHNVALAGLAVRPERPRGGLVALARVVNHDRVAREVTVELTDADGGFLGVKNARVEPDGEAPILFDGLPDSLRAVSARLSPGDAYALDDLASAVVPAGEKGRLLLVSPGNTFLERALAFQPDLEVYRIQPEDYARLGTAETFDAYVFDRFLPPAWPRGNALVLGPPEATAPLQVGAPATAGEVVAEDPQSPFLRYVAWEEVHVARANRLSLPSGWRTVLRSPAGPLLAVGEVDGRRVAVLPFALQESDLPLRTAFPVLMQNLLDWLLPGGFALPAQVEAGEGINVTPSPAAEGVAVITPGGRRVPLAPPFPPVPFSDTARPGLYTVVQSTGGRQVERSFAVHAPAAESAIAPRAELPLAEGTAAARGTAGLTNAELWPWFGWAALAVLILEWWVSARAR